MSSKTFYASPLLVAASFFGADSALSVAGASPKFD